MASSSAKTRANVKYNRSRDNIMIRPTKEDGARIRKAAAGAGLPVQRFILTLVFSHLDKEDENDEMF